MTFDEMARILRSIKYKDWEFHLGYYAGGEAPFLQIRFTAKSNYSDEVTEQHGRKWLLSYHMCRSEVVQTALMAVLAAEEHEARERFTYNGWKVFSPHFDVEGFCELARNKRIEVRG